MDSLIALVPARGGSKGVPRKNLRLINGKSLTELAILRAQKTGLFSEVWVSTDDDEIESQSLAMGARVLRRSGRTGSDSATANEVVEEFISSLNLEKSVSICYLQPTSPLLRSRTVQSAVSIHQESGKRPVVGIRRVTEPAGKHVFLGDNEEILETANVSQVSENRQNLPQAFIPTGGVYIFSVEDFLERGTIPVAGSNVVEISDEEALDIDSEFDLRIARILSGDVDAN